MNAVDQSMREAVEQGIFPSAEFLVARHGEIVHHGFYGDARTGTTYDVASLTKPMCTAALAMLLHGDGVIDLGQTVGRWFGNECSEDHRTISLRALLNHVSGLPAWRPFYRELPQSLVGTEEGRRYIVDACMNEPLAQPAGQTLYSDVGYIILGEVIAKAAGRRLDEFFAERIAGPWGLVNTFFVRNGPEGVRTTSRRTDTSPGQHIPVPSSGAHADERTRNRRFAATEDCHWRQRVVHGEVHDQNAYAMGGVAGHAGLFSDATDIHAFVTAFMASFRGTGPVTRATIEHFFPLEDGLIKPPAPGAFVGGWDTPSATDSAAGHHASPHSIGHLAYTGCSVWIDQAQDFWMILLTNRIHPSTTNERIKAFRPHIHDLAYRELIAHSKM